MDYHLATSNIFLTYHPDFIVRSTSLTRVMIRENDEVNLIVFGEGLPVSDYEMAFYCVFGPWFSHETHSHPLMFDSIHVDANRTSDGLSVTCPGIPTFFPDVPATISRFNVTLSLSFDLQELQWNQTLDYYLPPVVSDVLPNRAT
jgi:hypothetical protein